MTVTPMSIEVTSGETVTLAVRCEPFERLWEYEVWRGDRLLRPATRIGVGSGPGGEAIVSIPTLGWAACEPPGYFATYRLRLLSVTCVGGSRGDLRFGFPHLNETHHDRHLSLPGPDLLTCPPTFM